MVRTTMIGMMALAGCDDGVTLDETNLGADTPTEPVTFPPPACDEPVVSACGEGGAVIQGQVRVAPDLVERTQGSLYLALVHEAYGGAAGGGYHIDTRLNRVDLAEPVPFVLDMCEGGEMWSETNCAYSLQVILDYDRDQSVTNLLPDAGEPSARVADLQLSCDEAPPCLDIVLDCIDGPSCAAFEDLQTCDCEAAACPSVVDLCEIGR